MTDILDPLIRDLVEWVAKEPRPYGDVLEAWRTSAHASPCGRMPLIVASSSAGWSKVGASL